MKRCYLSLISGLFAFTMTAQVIVTENRIPTVKAQTEEDFLFVNTKGDKSVLNEKVGDKTVA